MLDLKYWFLQACAEGDLDCVKGVHEDGIEINIIDEEGFTGLMLASGCGHLDIVKYLHKYGCSLSEKNNIGWDALMVASFKHRFHVVKFLLEQGCDIQAQTKKFGNVVSVAMLPHQHNREVPIFLLEHGCLLQKNKIFEWHQNSLKIAIENRIQKINIVHNTIKTIWPDVALLVIDLISNFTNGLENLKIAHDALCQNKTVVMPKYNAQ